MSQVISTSGPTLVIDDMTVLIFGASGDLTARKLIPALFRLHHDGFLSEKSAVIGVARREKSHETFRDEMRKAVTEFGRGKKVTDESWPKFANQLFYVQHDINDNADAENLRLQVEKIEQGLGLSGRRLAYLATAPELFLPSVESLHAAKMVPPAEERDKLRVVVEKPFGQDLESSLELNKALRRILHESQIYRIDHYLGKETVQNILLFRFGNAIFEPLFNRNHIDHIEITTAESQGIEGGRGGYYDQSGGALRDVLQNHVLQLLCLIAMEPPALFEAEYIRNEKLKVLQALAPGRSGPVSEWAVAGQYAAAAINGKRVKAYLDEDRIAPDSRRETFVAVEARIDNWRWAGVPFYMRTGKRMPARVTEIAVTFKLPPLNLFTTIECDGNLCGLAETRPNTLLFRIQPKESIRVSFSAKRPGMQYQVQPVDMEFDYSNFEIDLPEAYERLLLDAMRGDSTLFTRSDELEAAWKFCEPMLQAWSSPDHHPELYPAGTWGPRSAHELLQRTGRKWRNPGGTQVEGAKAAALGEG
ncbi:glucose-6-phosphate dehydrogenase [Planctomyces sp. SH-PL14]|uniref:glucose-6-phosphate dehydrogenase n=1 Tax=Planctomyces sp. SH-PL14 TaxID=1632864 RepID=UPI00078D6430|nr:glucose-6-phosphate dehydrogenase [Planctomyces sp. SH-PL14]AMV20055.1 Glucose-6-phosphate 1-dehydrogenase [Planctomyces sp. SH-PL14]